ncbi:protein-L-isoaspartate(D-aspartate) O-methyltransferase, partial [Streptomyces sp. TRM76130]|nr:protein-L-isoaspartate(D-aspartate) O-methyltransferase [Streptomyces sp. TRM76130]
DDSPGPGPWRGRRYLASPASDMTGVAPPLGLLPDLSEGKEREAVIGADALGDWTSRFVGQSAVPGAQRLTLHQDGRTEDVLVDVETGSWAAVHAEGGRWLVRQDGPDALWDAVE